MDAKLLKKWIETEANAIWEKLRFIERKNVFFVFNEIANKVNQRLRRHESTRYQVVDFTHDETPTEPDGHSTRVISETELEALRDEARERKEKE